MASSIKALVAGLLGSNGDGLQAEQGLFHRIWDRVKQVYRQLRGGRVDKTERPQPAHRDRYVNQKLEKGVTDRLVERLFAGEINHQQWTLEARQEIKKSFIAQYVYAHGGPQSMTQADWGRIGAMVKPQYAFLRNFEQDLIDGKLSEAQAKARLRMYTKASRQAFEQGRAYAQGLPRLPAYPGDGSTQCLCIVSGASRVLTSGGWVPIADVRPGDWVLTHAGKLQRVLATIRKPSMPYHSLVQIHAPTGQWVECTDNHLWYTPDGWHNAIDIDSHGILWYHVHTSILEGVEHGTLLPEMWGAIVQPEQSHALPGLPVGMPLWQGQGFSSQRVLDLCDKPKSQAAMAGYEAADAGVYSGNAQGEAIQAYRHHGGYAMAGAQRRATLDMVLGERSSPHGLPVSVDMGASVWANSGRARDPSPGWGLLQRRARQPGADGAVRARSNARGRVPASAGVGMPSMRADFLQAAAKRSPEQVLFAGVLPQGTTLYDLEVEGDHSFVIEGLVAHNSNCACHWDIDEQPTEWLAVWTLGAAEHCPDCLQRADDWAPYRVQKAMI